MTRGRIAGRAVEISRTGYTGDLGYEVWMQRDDAGAVWDAIVRAGPAYGLRPTGLLALDVARIEAGLLLIDVDFFSARKALTTSQLYTPFEMGLDRLVDLSKPPFIGPRRARGASSARGPRAASSGSRSTGRTSRSCTRPSACRRWRSATASRVAVPVFAGSRQIGRMTSSTWSPVLKQMIGLATVDAAFAGPARSSRSSTPWTPSATASAPGRADAVLQSETKDSRSRARVARGGRAPGSELA